MGIYLLAQDPALHTAELADARPMLTGDIVCLVAGHGVRSVAGLNADENNPSVAGRSQISVNFFR